MVTEPTITSSETELLSQEGELLTKKEQGENLESEDQKTLDEINSLKELLKERFKEKDIPQKTKEEILSLQAQKDHFRTKFNKEKEDKEKLVKEMEESKKKAPLEEKSEWQEKVDFLLVHKDTSKEEFEFIAAIAKGKGTSLEDAVNTKEVKEYIDFQREKVAKDKSIPGSDNAHIGGFKLKTREEMAEMKPLELKVYMKEAEERKKQEAGV